MSSDIGDQKNIPIGKFLRFLIVAAVIIGVITAFGLLFSGVTLLFPNDSLYSSVRFQTSLKQEPLKLFGRRGDSITFYIEDHSVAGKWATPGIVLNFERKDPQLSVIELYSFKETSWGDSIRYSQRSDHKFKIECSFTVPAFKEPENQIVNGRVKGTITIPKGSGSARGFTNHTINLNVPVTLEVTSAERYKELQDNRFGKVWQTFFSFLPLAVLGVIGLIWMEKGEKWKYRNEHQTLLTVFWVLYLILFLVLVITMIGED